MKKYLYNIVLASILIIFSSLFTSCEKEDLGVNVLLKSFGPTPVLRGGEIRFIGDNMAGITSIIFPDNVEVTEITVVNATEIRVVVPQEASVGRITLRFPNGEVTTTAEISYTEPYSISSLSPIDVPLNKGETLTINGDYLWNMVGVVFMNDFQVDSVDFISQSRMKIELAIPREAVSGKIRLVDIDGNALYSDQEIEVIPTLPAVNSITTATIKAGADITLTGENIDLIESIVFTNGKAINEFVSISMTELVVTVPVDAKDGKIKYIAYSGAEIETTDVITLVKPVITAISPLSITAGDEFTVTGTDLDLITSVLINTSECEIISTSETSLTVQSVTSATTGKVTVTAGNGDSSISTEDIVVTPKLASGTLWEGSMNLEWSGVNNILIDKTIFTEDKTIKVEFTKAEGSTGSMQIRYWADWTSFNLEGADSDGAGSFTFAEGTTQHTITLSGANLILAQEKGLRIVGSGITATKVSTPVADEPGTGTVLLPTGDDVVWCDFVWGNTAMSVWGYGVVVSDVEGDYWTGKEGEDGDLGWKHTFAGTNNIACPAEPENVELRYDIMITEDFSLAAAAATVNFLFDGAYGADLINSDFIPVSSDGQTATTGGKWVTVRLNLKNDVGIAVKPTGAGDTGLVVVESSGFPWTKVRMRNFRYHVISDTQGLLPTGDDVVWCDFVWGNTAMSVWGYGVVVSDTEGDYWTGKEGEDGDLGWKHTFAGTNNIACPAEPENVELRYDIMVAEDFSLAAATATVNFLFDDAYGADLINSDFVPVSSDGQTATTGGKWVTVRLNLKNDVGIAVKPTGAGDTGLVVVESSGFPWTKVRMRNFRYHVIK